jgi:ABC-type uncharacterized transport system ATPase subunit
VGVGGHVSPPAAAIFSPTTSRYISPRRILRQPLASGTVAELQRSERRPVLRVEVEGAPLGWTTGLEHVEPIEGGGERTLLALDDGADTQRVLDAARAAGRVRHFAEVRPSLGESFREVIER